MKVEELIAKLSALPQNLDVYQSRDEEGNAFYPVSAAEVDAEIRTKEGTPVVILWPGWPEFDFYIAEDFEYAHEELVESELGGEG